MIYSLYVEKIYIYLQVIVQAVNIYLNVYVFTFCSLETMCEYSLMLINE